MANLTDLERKQYHCLLSLKKMPPTSLSLYRQCFARIKEMGDLAMNAIEFHVPSMEELMKNHFL